MFKCRDAITNALHPACFSLREINQALRCFASNEPSSLKSISPEFVAEVDEQGMEKEEEEEKVKEERESLVLRSSSMESRSKRKQDADFANVAALRESQILGPIAKDFAFFQVNYFFLFEHHLRDLLFVLLAFF